MEQQSISANLSLPLRKQILSIPITFSDLEFVDDELYNNLVWLKRANNREDVSSLMLDFTVAYPAKGNQNISYDLIPDGSQISVTIDNKIEYLSYRLRHR
jgi:hypothetical protein